LVTFTIRGVHLAIAGAFLAGILIAVGAVFALGGDDETSAPPQQVSAENLDVAPTSAPTTAPSATPAPSPTPEPPAAPQIRTCDEIRATGTYNSDEERAFFLANCVTQPAAGGGAASNPPPSAASSAQATADEANYRTKAEASLIVIAVRLEQYFNTPSLGAINDVLELGTVLRTFAQQLDRLPAPPPRFKHVHDQLRNASLAFADHLVTVQTAITLSLPAFEAWLEKWADLGEAFIDAMDDYSLVVGIDLPAFFLPE
jgi:hypothetical protein